MKIQNYLILALLLAVCSTAVFAQSKHDFVEMVENTDYCFDCYTIYKITKAADAPLNKFEFEFENDKKQKITKNTQLLIQRTENYEAQEDIIGPCPQISNINNETQEETTPSQGNCAIGSQTIQKERQTYQPITINQLKQEFNAAPIGSSFFVKITGKLGQKEAIDNILTLNDFSYPEYAWWNSSFQYRQPINCTNVDHGVPIAINGKNGFNISGNNQIVWTLCSNANLSVYYNNATDYVIANDTGQVPFDVEKGNRTGYNSTGVWNNHRFVYHFGQTSGTNVPDSSPTSQNATLSSSGANWTTSGFVGPAYYFSGSEYANRGSIFSTAPTNYTFSGWVNSDSWTYSTNTMPFGHQQNGIHRHVIYRLSNDLDFTNHFTSDVEIKIPTSSFGVGAWHYFVSQYNGTHYQVFINGTLNSSVAMTYAAATPGSANPITNIAANQGSHFFKGKVDEFRYTNKSMTPSQVNQTFQNAIGTSGYGTIGIEELQNLIVDETEGRNAIVQGIQSSTLTSYTIGTDEIVHIRLANGSQYQGTFDKTAITNEKIWAFNYDQNTSAGFPTFFNITGAFYFWQNYNLSFDNIKTQVTTLINATN